MLIGPTYTVKVRRLGLADETLIHAWRYEYLKGAHGTPARFSKYTEAFSFAWAKTCASGYPFHIYRESDEGIVRIYDSETQQADQAG